MSLRALLDAQKTGTGATAPPPGMTGSGSMPPPVAPTPGARVTWAATASPALKAEPGIRMEPDAQGAPPDTLAEMRASMSKRARREVDAAVADAR